MKNLINMIIVIFTLSLTSQVFAQNSSFGVRAGISAATLSDDPMVNDPTNMKQDYVCGLNFVAFGKFGFGNVFSLQPEIQFVQKGTRYINENANPEAELKERYNFLEIPILAMVDMGSGPVVFNVFAGPSVGYAMTGKLKGTNIQMLSEEAVLKPGDFESDIVWDDEYGSNNIVDNRLDLSLVAGFGVEFDLGPVLLLFDGRYNVDFLDRVIYEDKPSPTPDKYFNRHFNITAGVAIPFGITK